MKLLVVGSQNNKISEAIQIAKNSGATVLLSNDIENAMHVLRSGNCIDYVFFDVFMDIKSFIKSLEIEKINCVVLGYGISNDPKEAVKAIKAGAKDFIPLPPDEKVIAELFVSLANKSRKPFIFQSQSIAEIISVADRVAKSDANILITGESGTGKEVLASYIHHNSNRSAKSFVKVNCAAIPENLIESELFGYEKGAFTGALSRRIGKFEESSGGTLLLDEITEMELRLQSKLLRAIQEQEIDRIGGDKPVKMDLRIIATSNRDMMKEIKFGKFREDLFFRVNVIDIKIPPLRERTEDVEIISKFFVKKYCTSNNMPEKKISKQTMEFLKSYEWPGNVRELENVIHRSVLLSNSNEITKENLRINRDDSNMSKNLSEKDDYLSNNDLANILNLSILSLKDKVERLERDIGKNN